MKTDVLRSKSKDELKAELSTLKKGQYNLRIQKVSGQLEKVAEVRKTRRSVARVMTLLREQELGLQRTTKAGAGDKKAAKKKDK